MESEAYAMRPKMTIPVAPHMTATKAPRAAADDGMHAGVTAGEMNSFWAKLRKTVGLELAAEKDKYNARAKEKDGTVKLTVGQEFKFEHTQRTIEARRARLKEVRGSQPAPVFFLSPPGPEILNGGELDIWEGRAPPLSPNVVLCVSVEVIGGRVRACVHCGVRWPLHGSGPLTPTGKAPRLTCCVLMNVCSYEPACSKNFPFLPLRLQPLFHFRAVASGLRTLDPLWKRAPIPPGLRARGLETRTWGGSVLVMGARAAGVCCAGLTGRSGGLLWEGGQVRDDQPQGGVRGLRPAGDDPGNGPAVVP